ncbi:HAD family hydrolase [Streptomyces sp. NPDC002564]|uniref:HAD family hydrolase n=1 Tax=Streptomyces sp. NPDC002564 TaxID=3364649 RepID=UPI00369DEDC3
MNHPPAAATPGPHPAAAADHDIVLFDMFGVIARHQSEDGKDRLAALAGGSAPAFWDAYWTLRPPYDRGDVTGPAYWRQVADALGTDFTPAQVARLVEADVDSWSAVDASMVDLVEELAAAGRPVALLSNIPEELAASYEERYAWLKHFRVCAFSCRIGHAKPEPGAYRWCLDALGVTPERVLFVDDRDENIRAAEALGVRGHLFTGPARLREALGLSG